MSVDQIDIIEYNLNDNYRRYGFSSIIGSKSSKVKSFQESNSINADTVNTTDLGANSGIFTSIVSDTIQTSILTASQINGFELLGPINFNNHSTQNLVVNNFTAEFGSITNMTTIESDKIVINGPSGSITLDANFLTSDHTITFPPNNDIGVLRNNGFGDLVWMNDLFMNSIAIGDISSGSSNIILSESKLHIKGSENTTGGILIESNVDNINRLAIFPDSVINSTGIQKLANGSLTFYDSLNSKDFELDSSGDGIFYNDVNIMNNISGGGRLTLRVRTVTNNTNLDDDYIVNVNKIGPANIDLPPISDSTYTGVTYMVIKQNGNLVRVRADGSDDIHSSGVDVGQVDLTGSAGELLVVTNNGVKWFVIPS